MSRPAIPPIATASRTDVGVRRAANEDFLAEFERPSRGQLLVVADGMGGHRGGATASRLCVETIGEVFQRSTESPERFLADVLEAANDSVRNAAAADPELRRMGTTVALLLFTPEGEAWVAHVGDSRVYRMRDGVIEPLTEDHSVVGAMVRRGILTEEEAARHPRRNEVLRCIGTHADPLPDIESVDVRGGDRFVLCSDGLCGQLVDSEIARILQDESLDAAAQGLVDAANAAGGVDNVTVVVAAVPGGVTTSIDEAPQLLRGAGLEAGALRDLDRRGRRTRTIAGLTALVAGLLALAVLWLTFGCDGR